MVSEFLCERIFITSFLNYGFWYCQLKLNKYINVLSRPVSPIISRCWAVNTHWVECDVRAPSVGSLLPNAKKKKQIERRKKIEKQIQRWKWIQLSEPKPWRRVRAFNSISSTSDLVEAFLLILNEWMINYWLLSLLFREIYQPKTGLGKFFWAFRICPYTNSVRCSTQRHARAHVANPWLRCELIFYVKKNVSSFRVQIGIIIHFSGSFFLHSVSLILVAFLCGVVSST